MNDMVDLLEAKNTGDGASGGGWLADLGEFRMLLGVYDEPFEVNSWEYMEGLRQAARKGECMSFLFPPFVLR